MVEITDHFTGDIRPPLKGQVIYRDDTLTGFGLRVTASCKAYIAECKVNGTARRVTLGRCGSIAANEARAQAEKLIKQMSASRLPSKRSIQAPTLRELLALYLDRKPLRPATVLTYKRVINGCLQDWMDKPINMIDEEMVQTRHRELSKPNHMGTLGHDHANSAMHVLSRLLNYAADNVTGTDGQPIITANPVWKLNQNRLWYKTNRRELVVPDHKLADWYQAVMSLENNHVRDYVLLLILTGLRRTEAIRLRWSDANFEEQTLTIPAEVSKNHREHRLPLSDFLLAMLENRRAESGKSGKIPRKHTGHFHLVGKPCSSCEPKMCFALLSPEEMMRLPTQDCLSFSLKVYASAFFIGLEHHTGSPLSAESTELLQMCSDQVARGHWIDLR